MIETADIFTRRGDAPAGARYPPLVRAGGHPPHADRFERAGFDLAALLGGDAGMGVIVGLLLGAGLFCIWWSCWTPGRRGRAGVEGGATGSGTPWPRPGCRSIPVRALAVACVLLAGVVLPRRVRDVAA